jgi:hypothetical protein
MLWKFIWPFPQYPKEVMYKAINPHAEKEP